MATVTKNKTSGVFSRIPTTGWWTLGKSSGGTNQNAQITWAAFGIAGVISAVHLYIPWNNTSAGEGYSAAGAMGVNIGAASEHLFTMTGASGTADVDISSGGWSNASAFTLDIRAQSGAANSTSKGCDQDAYIIVTYTPYSDVVAPTALSVNQTVSENNVTLSWSGAANGTGGSNINGYDVYYRDSATTTFTAAWTLLQHVTSTATSGSLSVAPPATRGYYRQFRIIATSSLGSTYNSAEKLSTNNLRMNQLPTKPTALFEGGLGEQGSAAYTPESTAVFQWAAVTDPDGQSVTYQVQPKVRDAGNTAWIDDGSPINVGSATSYSFNITGKARGQALWYNVRSVDSEGAVSAWDGPYQGYHRNLQPSAPTIAFPAAGATIYNTQPRVSFQIGTDGDGDTMVGTVKFDTFVTMSSGTGSAYWSKTGSLASGARALVKGPALAAGSHTITCTENDGQVDSTAVTRAITIASLTWTDPALVAGMTVKAAHVLELRAAINNVLNYYGMAAHAWAALSVNTDILAAHITDLRAQFEAIRTYVNGIDANNSTNDIAAFTWTDPALAAGDDVLAVHITEMRALIPTL